MKIKQPFNCNNIYFTSDPHWGHVNIIDFVRRPFERGDVNTMNKVLVERWNSIVPKDGIVFCLGDMFFRTNRTTMKWILNSLNGTIYFVRGNHDRSDIEKLRVGTGKLSSSYFKDIGDIMEISVVDPELGDTPQKVVLCHYPILSWNGVHRGSWHLFGHTHGTLKHPNPKAMEVGVDCNPELRPYTWEEIKIQITKQHINKDELVKDTPKNNSILNSYWNICNLFGSIRAKKKARQAGFGDGNSR